MSKLAPEARREVQLDADLDWGAKVLFDYLTDCSLWSGHNMGRGVIRYSNRDLARAFKVSIKTIQNWKRQLAGRGVLWLTEKFMKNCYATTVYNITKLVGQKPLPFASDFEDGSCVQDDNERVSNRRRFIPGQRDAKGHWVSAKEKTSDNQKSAQNADSEHARRKILPASLATGCQPRTKQVASPAGNGLPAGHETGCVGGAKQIARVAGNGLPAGHETGCQRGTKQIADYGETQAKSIESKRGGKAPSPPDRASKPTKEESELERWRQSLNGMFPSKLEKMLQRLTAQKDQAKAPNLIAFLRHKIRIVKQILDGPLPEFEAPAVPARAASPAPPAKPMTDKELLETAQIAVRMGATGLLTSKQRELLASAAP